ncbi:MAG: HEAT repeat domain-containing protein [Planctomycetota bacterium]|nr:HEAT repeat domain-containing protein [Planctomycetota bacterium]
MRAFVVVLALATLVFATELERLVQDLASKDYNVRNAALAELRKRRDERAIPILLAALETMEGYNRILAVGILESYPASTALRAYRKLAKSSDPFLRLSAGSGLLRGGEKKGVKLIVAALGVADVDTQTCTSMVDRLRSIKHEKIQAALLDLIAPGVQTVVLYRTLDVLDYQKVDGTLARVVKLAAAEDPKLKVVAAGYAYRNGMRAYAKHIVAALETGKLDSGSYSILSGYLTKAPTVSKEILEALTARLAHMSSSYEIGNVTDVLAKHNHRGAIPALKKLLAHKSTSVAEAGFQALGKFPDAVDNMSLTKLLTSESENRRLWAADMLRRRNDLSGEAIVVAAVKSKSQTTRSKAVTMLRSFKSAKSAEALIDALADESSSIRQTAAYSLEAVLRALFPYRGFDLAAAGYQSQGAPEARAQALEKIRAWWRKHRQADW